MKIEVLEWGDPFRGVPEVERTSATLQIRIGNENATRLEDLWSQSVQPGARVAAYPLALWLAFCWWRLRWEPEYAGPGETPSDWRMSHELPAAGYGFLWPPLVFAGDDEAIGVRCRQSAANLAEPVRYLANFDAFVPVAEFESAVDEFLDLVLRRLDSLGTTELHRLWEEVRAERADPAQAAVRQLEARLGFDPDEAPESLLRRMLELREKAGPGAAGEVAPICVGPNAAKVLSEVEQTAMLPGVPGRVPVAAAGPPGDGLTPPWRRGYEAARRWRDTLPLRTGPVGDADLAGLLEMPAQHLSATTARAPLGMAVRTGPGEQWKFLFRSGNQPGRRFEAARFLGDSIYATAAENWLPLTASKTARQKYQRAFAAEFLCPIDSLRQYLSGRRIEESIEDAAEYYGISDRAVEWQLENHGLESGRWGG